MAALYSSLWPFAAIEMFSAVTLMCPPLVAERVKLFPFLDSVLEIMDNSFVLLSPTVIVDCLLASMAYSP